MTREEILSFVSHGKWALCDLGDIVNAGTWEDAEVWWFRRTLTRQEYEQIAEMLRKDIVRAPELHSVISNRSRTLLLWLVRQMIANV